MNFACKTVAHCTLKNTFTICFLHLQYLCFLAISKSAEVLVFSVLLSLWTICFCCLSVRHFQLVLYGFLQGFHPSFTMTLPSMIFCNKVQKLYMQMSLILLNTTNSYWFVFLFVVHIATIFFSISITFLVLLQSIMVFFEYLVQFSYPFAMYFGEQHVFGM